MGMAASQARLLSITSRMADNELRAQIINNSKMRLATESSRVSEEYVSALNQATMMMSNYDLTGESQYQKLTFNSLTSYSAYNNQYGLINANGKILVSEKDAGNYRDTINTGGDLDDFLKLYGLEYTSTYFTSDTLGAETITIEGIDDFSVDQLKEMYEGNEEKNILSYDNALQSSEYVDYTDYYNTLVVADQKYAVAINDEINETIFDEANLFKVGGQAIAWDDLYEQYFVSEPKSASDYSKMLDTMKNALNTMVSEGKLSSDSDWYKSMLEMINDVTISGSTLTLTSELDVDISGNNYTIGDSILINRVHHHSGKYVESSYGNYVLDPDTNQYREYNADTDADLQRYRYEDPYDDTLVSVIAESENDMTYSLSGIGSYKGESNACALKNIGDTMSFQYIITEQGEDDPEQTVYNVNYKLGEATATMSTKTTDTTEIQGYIRQIYDTFRSGIASAVERDAFADGDPDSEKARDQFNEALYGMIGLVFGESILNNTDKVDLIKSNFAIFSDPGSVIAFVNEHPELDTTEQFEVIKNIYVLDTIFNVYGEPAWGWVDVNNPDENADAKVQWYTNLFNRMQQGYSIIENGLASNNEWIEFALESGLVSMIQVDSDNNWVTMSYTNCSDISEATNDAAVTIAEAEYNKAMNSIENKDKRYDMELKNIDTEHNSLQTEYDSVKSVIDKNIERSFKIYS